MRVKIHRATSKKPPPIWGLDGGAGVLRAKIVIFAYSAGAQRLPQARSACCRRAAPAASAEGASMAGRAPQARGCSITRRGKLLYKRQARSACCRRAAPAASAEGASIAGRAPQARGCSITRRGKLLYRASEASEDGSKRPERSEGRLRSPVGANTLYSITRRGFRAPQARVRAPKARARRPFNIYIHIYYVYIQW